MTHALMGKHMEDWTAAITTVFHWISGLTIVATIVGWFPAVAAFIAASWYLVQLYESATVQTWLRTRRLRKIAAFKVRIAVLEAQEKKARAHRRASEVEASDG